MNEWEQIYGYEKPLDIEEIKYRTALWMDLVNKGYIFILLFQYSFLLCSFLILTSSSFEGSLPHSPNFNAFEWPISSKSISENLNLFHKVSLMLEMFSKTDFLLWQSKPSKLSFHSKIIEFRTF